MNYPSIHVMSHPLIQHKISMLRRVQTSTKDFHALVREITLLIGYEATRNLPLESEKIRTPLMEMDGPVVNQKVCIVPILRAGLGMVDAMRDLLPASCVGHIGLFRDPETKKPVEYYCKVPPDIAHQAVIILDPMLATGGSAAAAATCLKQRGAKDITMINVLGAPEGAAYFSAAHPDVNVYLGCMDQGLNSDCYILPGLGDAGDRLFGTL